MIDLIKLENEIDELLADPLAAEKFWEWANEKYPHQSIAADAPEQTAEDILEKHCPSMNNLYLDNQGRAFRDRILAAMEAYRLSAPAVENKDDDEVPGKTLADKAAIYLEKMNISGDTMVSMNHSLDNVPKENQGAYYLHDILAGFAEENESLPQELKDSNTTN